LSEEKKYRNYTAVDIEKYHKGLLSAKEMHEVEKAALDDPFLAEALEGYGAVSVNAAADLSELGKKLQERIKGAKVISMAAPRSSYNWWKVAAAIVIIGGLGFFIFRLSTNNNNKEVAKLEEKKKSDDQAATTIIDSNKVSDLSKLTTPDTNSLANTNKGKTAATSQKKISTRLFNTSTGSINKDIAATSTTPEASVPLHFKTEKNDSVDGQKNAVGNANVFSKSASKKPEAENRQLEGLAAMQQKEIGLREQQKINYFRGSVVDANKNPLPFANITNTRDNVGTYADARGNFTLISPDSTLDVQVRSIGFENNLARLKNNVVTNQVILQEDKVSPDRIISYKKADTNRSRTANMKFEETEPADGWGNYDVYLANNIKVPDNLERKESNGGQVEVSFDVNQDGDPINIKVERSLCQKCDEEAIRLIKEGPKWKKKNKKAKRVTIAVPFDGDH
jgi:TonB family protein